MTTPHSDIHRSMKRGLLILHQRATAYMKARQRRLAFIRPARPANYDPRPMTDALRRLDARARDLRLQADAAAFWDMIEAPYDEMAGDDNPAVGIYY